jgi:hypothetical protein
MDWAQDRGHAALTPRVRKMKVLGLMFFMVVALAAAAHFEPAIELEDEWPFCTSVSAERFQPMPSPGCVGRWSVAALNSPTANSLVAALTRKEWINGYGQS